MRDEEVMRSKIRYRSRQYRPERKLITKLLALKNEAARLGLWQTFQSLDATLSTLGWECANTEEIESYDSKGNEDEEEEEEEEEEEMT